MSAILRSRDIFTGHLYIGPQFRKIATGIPQWCGVHKDTWLILKIVWSISRTNAGSQWNPFYGRFHWIRFFWKWINWSVVIRTWSCCGKTSTRGCLREANVERSEIIVPCEFGTCSYCQNVEETQIWVCGHLHIENRCAMADSNFSCGLTHFFSEVALFFRKFFPEIYTAVLHTQVPTKCTALDFALQYILIVGTQGKFAMKNSFEALGVCFPQTCSSTGSMFAASTSRSNHHRPIGSLPQRWIRFKAL